MAWVKVTDIAYGRLRALDLDVFEEFLTRFGMHRSGRTANALCMRGTDPNHHIHVTEKGDPKFVGLAYYVENEDGLKRLTKAPGASGIENIDEPGGGKRVRLKEPNGYQIEVVCGIAPVPEMSVRRQKLNSGESPLSRAGVDAAAERPRARQAYRPRRADDAALSRNGGLVSRHARVYLLRRRLCRGQEQRDHLVQPLRSGRALRQSSCVFLPGAREDRAQSSFVRGA